MQNVLDWRTLDLNDDIHYCDENKSTDTGEANDIYKKHGLWFLSSTRKIHNETIINGEQALENMKNKHVTPISFCPFCGVRLEL